MTKNQLWETYCQRNPSFRNPDNQITLTARGLKKMFDQTWDIAQKDDKMDGDFGDAFRDLFGGNKF